MNLPDIAMRLLVPLTLITAVGVGAYFLLAPGGPHWTKLSDMAVDTAPAPSLPAAPSSAPATCACGPAISGGAHGGVHMGPYAGHWGHHVRVTHDRVYFGARRYDWHVRQAEGSVDLYGYDAGAQSHIEYGVGADRGEAWAGMESHAVIEGGRREERRAARRVWVDGYGRAHDADIAVRQPGSEIDSRARLSPYHGYSDDWDDN